MSHQFNVRTLVLYKNRYCNQNEFDIIVNHESNITKDYVQTVLFE